MGTAFSRVVDVTVLVHRRLPAMLTPYEQPPRLTVPQPHRRDQVREPPPKARKDSFTSYPVEPISFIVAADGVQRMRGEMSASRSDDHLSAAGQANTELQRDVARRVCCEPCGDQHLRRHRCGCEHVAHPFVLLVHQHAVRQASKCSGDANGSHIHFGARLVEAK